MWLGSNGTQLVELRAREKRRVDLEVGVLGRRPDQRHQPLLDRGQQRVLLRLVEAMDLVEEEDRRLVRGPAALLGPLDHGADLGPPRVHRRELLERPAARGGDDPGQGGLPGARRPVEDRRVRLPGLDRRAQRRALAQQVLLAEKLVQGARSHPDRQGRLRRRNAGSAELASGPCRTAAPSPIQYDPGVDALELIALALWSFAVSAVRTDWWMLVRRRRERAARSSRAWSPRGALGRPGRSGVDWDLFASVGARWRRSRGLCRLYSSRDVRRQPGRCTCAPAPPCS